MYVCSRRMAASVTTQNLASPVDTTTDTFAPLLNAEQAGALLNVPPTWCLAQARANRIPHVRLGRYVRFDRDELNVWWQRRLQGPRARASR